MTSLGGFVDAAKVVFTVYGGRVSPDGTAELTGAGSFLAGAAAVGFIIALVTSGKPIWSAQVVARTRLSTTVRWVPIQSASTRPNIRLLNAARREGLAAQARGGD